MNGTTKDKIEQLHGIILANYKAEGNYDHAFAANCAMEMILKMAFGQPTYTDQLLDEEIADNLKASKRIAAELMVKEAK